MRMKTCIMNAVGALAFLILATPGIASPALAEGVAPRASQSEGETILREPTPAERCAVARVTYKIFCAPENITATAQVVDGKLQISWTPVAYNRNPGAQYEVTASSPGKFGGTCANAYVIAKPYEPSGWVSGTTCTISPDSYSGPLQSGLTVYVNVLAYYTDWNEPYPFLHIHPLGWNKEGSTVVTVCCAVPSEPREVQVVDNGAGRATVSWQPSTQFGGADAVTYKAIVPETQYSCETAENSCTMTGLPYGMRIVARVTAKNQAGPGPSAESTAILMKAPTPNAPRAVTAKRNGTAAQITWQAPAGTAARDLKRYQVRSSPLGPTCTARTVRGCQVKGLTPGTRYSFTVRAVGVEKPGPWSQPSPLIEVPTLVAPIPVAPKPTAELS